MTKLKCITLKVRTEDLITKQQATFNKVVESKEESQGWVDITTRLRSMFKDTETIVISIQMLDERNE